MTKSLFRALATIAGAALLSLASASACAATLTYNDPNCAGFQITGSGGSFTLTCAKLSCSISGLTTPTTAQDTSLTATCTPSGAGYTWSLVSGPFSDVACSAPSSPTAATTAVVKPAGIKAGDKKSCLYQVTATAPGLSGQAMATVTWSDAPPVAPVCSPTGVTTPTPMTSAGGTIALNANCNPSAGVTYTWTRTAPTAGAPTNPATATPSDTLAANTGASGVTYTWQVVGCNGTACDSAKSVTVVVPAPGGGGGGGSISCGSAFPDGTVVIDLPWANTSVQTSAWKAKAALVLRFTVPAGTPASHIGTPGTIRTVEYVDPKASRYGVLSTAACDFNGTYMGANPPAQFWDSAGLAIVDSVSIAQPAGTTLQPGTQYFINIKNTEADGATWSCYSGTCNVNINWFIPY